MRMDKRSRFRPNFGLSPEELSRLAKVGRMFRMERIQLKYNPKGDTVVSPCDFHYRPLDSPVKGPPVLLMPAHPCTHTHGRNVGLVARLLAN